MQLVENLFSPAILKAATRDGFGKGLLAAGEDDPSVVALTADLSESTRCAAFAQKYPDRFFECGVAEQNMMGVAAGLALSGKVPFAVSYAVFNPGRNLDQLRVAVCYSNTNVKIIGSNAGVTVGAGGASHQATEDIAITRVLPNLTVLVPCDASEAKEAVLAAAKHKGPVYIRIYREPSPVFTSGSFEIGKAHILREGKHVTIVACGPSVYEALVAANRISLERSIECEVINCSTIKPLDVDTIVKSAKKTGCVITVEDHQSAGGLGGAVCEALSSEHPVKVIRLGLNDVFGESGKPAELLEKFGINADHIQLAVRKLVR